MKNKKLKLIIIVIVLSIIIIFFSLSITFSKQKQEQKPISKINQNQEVIISKPIQLNYLPFTNYTCEDLMPNKFFMGVERGNNNYKDLSSTDKTLSVDTNFKNGINIDNQEFYNCWRNYQVGTNNHIFNCHAKFFVLAEDLKSQEGVTLPNKSFLVDYDFKFDERDCVFSSQVAKGNIYECKLLSFSCNWSYQEIDYRYLSDVTINLKDLKKTL